MEQTVDIAEIISAGEVLNTPGENTKKKKVPDFSRTFRIGGRNRTRIPNLHEISINSTT